MKENIVFIFIFTCVSLKCVNAIKIHIHNQSQDLIQFINDGLLKFEPAKVKKNAIMVLGLSGTGKTTLVNYLNEVPLIAKKTEDDLAYWIDLENENETLPGGFRIGHKPQSETLYPASYTPNQSDFSYIDNPGFADSRGIAINIANGFFRHGIIQHIKNLKFLLLIDYNGILSNRGENFIKTVIEFTEFLSINGSSTETSIIKMLSNSTGIIVTKADVDYDQTESKVKENLIKRLYNTSVSQFDKNSVNNNSKVLFQNILANNQLELFSKPKKKGRINLNQSFAIKDLINNLTYINSSYLSMDVKIPSSNREEVTNYLKGHYKNFSKNFEKELNTSFTNYFNKQITKIENLENVRSIYKKLNEIVTLKDREIEVDTFVNKIYEQMKNKKIIDEFNQTITIVSYFRNLLPDEYKNMFSFKEKWITSSIVRALNLITDDLLIIVSSYFDHFVSTIENSLRFNLHEYFKRSVADAIYLKDLEFLKQFLNNLSNFGEIAYDIVSFINKVDEKLLNSTQKLEYLNKMQIFNSFNSDTEKMKNLKNGWFNKSLKIKIANQINEINNYFLNNEEVSYHEKKNTFTYKSSFGRMSSVLKKINNHSSIQNLKSVLIFSTNSFIIDFNYKISKDKYLTDSPDLIIISPKIKVENNDINRNQLDIINSLKHAIFKIIENIKNLETKIQNYTKKMIEKKENYKKVIDAAKKEYDEGSSNNIKEISQLIISLNKKIIWLNQKNSIDNQIEHLDKNIRIFTYYGNYLKDAAINFTIFNDNENLNQCAKCNFYDYKYQILKIKDEFNSETEFIEDIEVGERKKKIEDLFDSIINNHANLIYTSKNVTTIDLSCNNAPYYPKNNSKAKNGYGEGNPGVDGEPGK